MNTHAMNRPFSQHANDNLSKLPQYNRQRINDLAVVSPREYYAQVRPLADAHEAAREAAHSQAFGGPTTSPHFGDFRQERTQYQQFSSNPLAGRQLNVHGIMQRGPPRIINPDRVSLPASSNIRPSSLYPSNDDWETYHRTSYPQGRQHTKVEYDWMNGYSQPLPGIYLPQHHYRSPSSYINSSIGAAQSGDGGLGFQNFRALSCVPTLNQVEQRPPTTPVRLSSPEPRSSPTRRLFLKRTGASRPTLPVARPFVRKGYMNRKDLPDLQDVIVTPSCRGAGNFGADFLDPRAIELPPIVQGIQLVPTSALPDRFRHIFAFSLFNAVQSKCFESVYKSDDNVVVSAPTGGGKTAILELAICRLLETFGSEDFKIVYQAPTRALCAERVRDWQKRFSHINLQCAELTGDTESSEVRKVAAANIIITTPEKWDSITRKWKDHDKLLRMVKLFLIDEVHILKETRGATLEAIVSRMKSIGANVRFLALSATVPNSHDIATWLGKNPTIAHLPAHREIFGEEFRPVKLQRHVHGFENNGNPFAFDSTLDSKLPSIISKYSHRKPIIIFCFTRKSCELTASKLSKWWEFQSSSERSWLAPTTKSVVINKDLSELLDRGVAFHHAGLEAQDRSTVESAYLRGQISVIVCTSTLAVGVNLPCHFVVIKGTVGYSGGNLKEYSDLEVMQMLGRAGRPQFDDSGIAVIMTRKEMVGHYETMVSGEETLESTLHLHLIEHLNSEIGLGTVHDLHSAKVWIRSTFLAVRMRQNPAYYRFDNDGGTHDTDERLEIICEENIKLLQEVKIVTTERNIKCTQYGEAMSRYMINFETMKLLLAIPAGASISLILQTCSGASEFSDLRLKPNERAAFRELNKSPFIKFPIKEVISSRAHKVSLLLQVQLGGVELPNDKTFNVIRRQFLQDKMLVFDRIIRLIKCITDCKEADQDGVATRNSLELARSIEAEYWEGTTMQLRQIPSVGPALASKLVQGDIKTIPQLVATDSATIERLCTRNPPFGSKIIEAAKAFPILSLSAEIFGKSLKTGASPRIQIKVHLASCNAKSTGAAKNGAVTFWAEVSTGALAYLWRGNIRNLQAGTTIQFSSEMKDQWDYIVCYASCDAVVGTLKTVEIRPDIPASAFPPPTQTVTASSAVPQKVAVAEETPQDYGSDSYDFDEADLCAIVQEAESSPLANKNDQNAKRVKETGVVVDEYLDIDDLSDEITTTLTPALLPVLTPLANGKYPCGHTCGSRGLTKTGKVCKHRCCKEGIDKPSKARRKRSATEDENDPSQKKRKSKDMALHSSLAGNARSRKLSWKYNELNIFDKGETQTIDLAGMSTAPLVNGLASKAYTKLGLLHSQVQDCDDIIRMANQNPTYSYAAGGQPDLSFLCDNENDFGSSPPGVSYNTEMDELDLPKLSSLIDDGDPFSTPDHHNIFGDNTQNHSGQSSQEYGEFIEDLEVAMVDIADSKSMESQQGLQVFGEDKPDEIMNFENAMFGFETDDDHPHPNEMSPGVLVLANIARVKGNNATADSLLAKLSEEKKVLAADTKASTAERVPLNLSLANSGDDASQLSVLPSWWDQVDNELWRDLSKSCTFVEDFASS